jgi:hypothetical protein
MMTFSSSRMLQWVAGLADPNIYKEYTALIFKGGEIIVIGLRSP